MWDYDATENLNKQFGSRSGLTSDGPDQGPNCLQRLSADEKSPLARKELMKLDRVQASRQVCVLIEKYYFLFLNQNIFVGTQKNRLICHLFDLILYISVNIFLLCSDGSSWVEPGLNKD